MKFIVCGFVVMLCVVDRNGPEIPLNSEKPWAVTLLEEFCSLFVCGLLEWS